MPHVYLFGQHKCDSNNLSARKAHPFLSSAFPPNFNDLFFCFQRPSRRGRLRQVAPPGPGQLAPRPVLHLLLCDAAQADAPPLHLLSLGKRVSERGRRGLRLRIPQREPPAVHPRQGAHLQRVAKLRTRGGTLYRIWTVLVPRYHVYFFSRLFPTPTRSTAPRSSRTPCASSSSGCASSPEL